ncbi:FAD-binding oxidoreductase [Hydrogenophaga sp. OTU3427]|uniref:FAD-binding oxidoreductase n=1 Tax=Hydrogenophaga sp. OTU3427 TaxID=3043856 RepID=UPI00313F3AA3
MSDSPAVQSLLRTMGRDLVATGDAIPDRRLQDWSGVPGARPLALLRPRTVEQLSQMLAVCNAHRQAVVPQGGLTGLAGGACCAPGDVAVSLERMNQIEELDAVSGTMTVQAGATLQSVQDAADAAGYLFALDLGARGSCTIGGNLSTNAGGNRVIRYGTMRDQLLGLEAVLADGSVVGGLHKMVKNNTGYDMRHLLAGAEGTLGIVTRAVLKLHPKPQSLATAWCGLPSFDAVTTLLRRAKAELPGGVSAFEVMWPSYLDFMLQRVPGLRQPLPQRHAFNVLMESAGADGEHHAAAFDDFLGRMLEAGVLEDAAIARSGTDARNLWAVRDATGEFPLLLPGMAAFDVSFSIRDIGQAALECEAMLRERWPGCTALVYGHLGDGNLHVIAHVDGSPADVVADIERAVYDLVRRYRGAVSAEHGIGLLKRKVLGHTRSPAELAAMRAIKSALDPHGILNPGKVL